MKDKKAMPYKMQGGDRRRGRTSMGMARDLTMLEEAGVAEIRQESSCVTRVQVSMQRRKQRS